MAAIDPIEISFQVDAALAAEVERLRRLLYAVGVCATCGEEISHDVTEPFATCRCGTGEDATGPSLLQRLREQLATATGRLAMLPPLTAWRFSCGHIYETQPGGSCPVCTKLADLRAQLDAVEKDHDALVKERTDLLFALTAARKDMETLSHLLPDINDACITLSSAIEDCDDYALMNTHQKLTAVREVLLSYLPNGEVRRAPETPAKP